ncbi:hypothetical protein [Moraxella sp. RCAD0137]|uniref:hypothetical protein n=1 Tax=Moraxella sp. RCAD0137 TaxID=1775913 RepID=UPI000C9F7C39|nr:hypothetical protein [Moraxella sp. RCAD0137]PNP99183.1 hypothetical protein AZ602_01950 [Moraxella sp. RCAD0137]
MENFQNGFASVIAALIRMHFKSIIAVLQVLNTKFCTKIAKFCSFMLKTHTNFKNNAKTPQTIPTFITSGATISK